MYRICSNWLPVIATVHWLLHPSGQKRKRKKQTKEERERMQREIFDETANNQKQRQNIWTFFVCVYSIWHLEVELAYTMRNPHTLTISKFIHETFNIVTCYLQNILCTKINQKPLRKTDWFLMASRWIYIFIPTALPSLFKLNVCFKDVNSS